jgi:hypothetical protein
MAIDAATKLIPHFARAVLVGSRSNEEPRPSGVAGGHSRPVSWSEAGTTVETKEDGAPGRHGDEEHGRGRIER